MQTRRPAETPAFLFQEVSTMTRQVPLDNTAHRNLRVVTRYGERYGNFTGSVPTFITEFGDIQREYPILFRKDPASNELMAVALLGLQRDENLFLEDDHWDASYIPGVISRGPFFIGRDSVLHVDLDDPRVSETEGESLFLEQGGMSTYLQRVALGLKGLSDGLAVNQQMFAAYASLNLIEAVEIEVTISETERYPLTGFFTISAQKLAALDGEGLLELNKAGFLFAAFLVVSSLNNVRKLIDLKSRRRRAAA
jgi:hypothetical protein